MAILVESAIRTARDEGVQLLSALAFRSKAHWGYDEVFMAACREELTVTAEGIARCPTFVYDDGSLRGFYQLTLEADAADIALFFVDPPAIGGGVGRALWRHLVGEAKQMGAVRITIEADPDAQGFYQRMGANVIGTVPSASIAGRELPLLEYSLA